MENTSSRAMYAHVIIKLLQGPIYSDDKSAWRDLLSWQSSIKEYFDKVGLELLISDTNEFARISQPDAEKDDDNPLPRLMRKQYLSYEATLLSVILRETLEEFDIVMEGSKLFLTQRDIKERIELFYKAQTNKSKLWKDLSKPINSLINVGILKLTREDSTNKDNNQFEVKRVIKALIKIEKLEEIKQNLLSYGGSLE
jgi:Domain of unknown function (DUF4194)